MVRSRASRIHPAALAIGAGALASAVVLVILTPSVLFVSIPALIICILYFLTARKGAGIYLRSVIGFLLLSLITPATILASGGKDYPSIIFAWLSVALFATSSVLVVGIRLGEPNAQRRAAIFHIAYLLAAVYAMSASLLPLAAMSAVAIVRYALIAASSSRFRALPIKTIGIMESMITVLALAASAVLP